MPRSISPEELMPLIGAADRPPIIDVRREAAFRADPRRIAGALWRDHAAAAEWGRQVDRGCGIVVYCSHGHNVSAMAAASLREAGIEAIVLEGGIAAFADAGGLLVCREAPGVSPLLQQPSVWVTRERPKIDRIACPWLIRRFIDPTAIFHFVPAEWVSEVAAEMNATPFDIADVLYSHRGETCSFDTFLAEFGLHDRKLEELALIVRGADTARPDLAPEAAGLLALSLGLSAIEDGDLRQLEKGMLLYDALYGWLRHARGEKHNWPKAS
jgi:rhodanese-related sulfurtransferase